MDLSIASTTLDKYITLSEENGLSPIILNADQIYDESFKNVREPFSDDSDYATCVTIGVCQIDKKTNQVVRALLFPPKQDLIEIINSGRTGFSTVNTDAIHRHDLDDLKEFINERFKHIDRRFDDLDKYINERIQNAKHEVIDETDKRKRLSNSQNCIIWITAIGVAAGLAFSLLNFFLK
jgi:hypothetical protein